MMYIKSATVKTSIESFKLFLTINSFVVWGIKIKKNNKKLQVTNLKNELSPGQTPVNFILVRKRFMVLSNSDFDILKKKFNKFL